jgi:hypothetical protein
MNTQPIDIPAHSIDPKAIATLIVELNIARRNCRAYPKGHPVVAASLAKVLRIYEELLSKHEELILGVTSDALMVEGVVLEKSNLVFQDFSRVLFERGIGALLFHSGLTIEELNNFTIILGLKREQIHEHGGIEQVWAKAKIAAMTIRPIRYDLFLTKDDRSVSSDSTNEAHVNLWDRFARELTLGDLSHGSSSSECLDPDVLAEILNKQFASGSINETELRGAITDFLVSDHSDSSSETLSDHPYEKLASFISNLVPELRRQLIDSSLTGKSRSQHANVERILSNLSDSAVLETLEDINTNRLSVSPVVLGLLQRLGQNGTSPQKSTEETVEDDDLSRKMKAIFREHASEDPVPDNYRKKLDHIITSDQIAIQNREDVSELLNTLENQSVETSIGQILMNLIREGVETPEERDIMLTNLNDMFSFYLQTGNYGKLLTMIDQMNDGTFPVEIQYRLRDEYGRREYLEEILTGLTVWGKSRYDDIRSLIKKFGGQFVEAILDRLSEEQNMSVRRFYIDCLIEMGPVTRVPIINRLYDNRWYFLRNLLIILVAQNDPTVIPSIRPLLRSEEPRLRHEVLKTLVFFHDPQAEKQVLANLDSLNPELQAAAILLAERCTSPDIAVKLTKMVSLGGFTQIECERKSTIVHALGEIGRADVLPELAKILSSWSLVNARHLTKLKTDIIRSLPKYPSKVARPVLESIAAGSGEIALLATETLKIKSGNQV